MAVTTYVSQQSVLTQNICCDHSLDPSRLGNSNGGHNICFSTVSGNTLCCDHSLEPSRLGDSNGGHNICFSTVSGNTKHML